MPTTQTLDNNFVRQQFPYPDNLAFFENAGGTLVPFSVIDRITSYMRECQVQPGAEYAPSATAKTRMDEAEALMHKMINAEPGEVIVGISTSMNIYMLAQGLRAGFNPGDEIIVTNLDHEANIGAWRGLEEFGLVIREWQVNTDTADLDIEDLDALLNNKTRLVCFSHCSNITGSINDVAAITRKVHDAGALVCVDGVAFAPHRRIDVKALDVDFYVYSPYKLYGPHLGILYGKKQHLVNAKGQNHFFIDDQNTRIKLNPGGPNHELTTGLSGIGDYFDALHAHHFPGANLDVFERLGQSFELISRYEEQLVQHFLDFANRTDKLHIIGRSEADLDRRVSTVSFVIEGRDSREIEAHAVRHNLAVRSGDFYARRLIEALRLDTHHGVVRASMVHYNSIDEVDRLIAFKRNTLKNYKALYKLEHTRYKLKCGSRCSASSQFSQNNLEFQHRSDPGAEQGDN